MSLAQEDFNAIGDFVQANISNWLSQQPNSTYNMRNTPPMGYDMDLRERMIRLEEELKAQRELMMVNFALSEKKFEQVEKRFDLIEKRFNQVFLFMGLGFTIITLFMGLIKFLK